jgi:predicted AAA+ superfamily ATPase
MIPRSAQSTLQTLAQGFPIVAITGPRQFGKTTLARAVFPDRTNNLTQNGTMVLGGRCHVIDD